MRVLLILVAMEELDASHAVAIPILAPPMTLPLLDEICGRAGHAVERLDTRFYTRKADRKWQLDWPVLEQALASSPADVACISFLSSSAANGMRVAQLCRRAGKTVIGGGLHASVALDEFLAANAFDYIVQGEAERTLPRLLNELMTGAGARHPPQTVIVRSPAERDLSIVPAVANLAYYQPVFDQYPGYRCAYIEISRGCFKECGFCEVARTGAAASPLRKIPLANVLATLDGIVKRHAINYLVIADSIATLFREHFMDVIAHIARNFPGLTVQFNATVDRWDETLARACADVSCNVWFGFESGSQRVLDRIIHKGTTVAQAHRAAEICREHAIPCAFNILLGLPGEAPEDYRLTLDVLQRCAWVYPNPNIFNPLPGTALFTLCQREGLLPAERDYSIWDCNRIAAHGSGPVRGVDYARVVEHYRIYAAMQNEEGRTLVRRWPKKQGQDSSAPSVSSPSLR